MNILESVIKPFEPHGMPTLKFIKDMGVIDLKTILNIMDALDAFMKGNALLCLGASAILEEGQLLASADHLCGWLEETATKAGADTVTAQARAMLVFSEDGERISIVKANKLSKREIVGFMFLVDFTVGNEKVNHLLDHQFKKRKT